MKKNLLYLVVFIVGVCIGYFVNFYLVNITLKKFFDEPWDVFWEATNSIMSTILGSFLGGIIAYLVALKQMNQQNIINEYAQKEQERILAERIKNELIYNYVPVRKIFDILANAEGSFNSLSVAISSNNKKVIEGINVYLNQINDSFLLQLRSTLHDTQYLEIHRLIDLLVHIKNTGLMLNEQVVPGYIEISLQRLLKLSKEYAESPILNHTPFP